MPDFDLVSLLVRVRQVQIIFTKIKDSRVQRQIQCSCELTVRQPRHLLRFVCCSVFFFGLQPHVHKQAGGEKKKKHSLIDLELK